MIVWCVCMLCVLLLLLQVMDTPRPDQVRPLQPEAEAATEEDCLEVRQELQLQQGLGLPLCQHNAARHPRADAARLCCFFVLSPFSPTVTC